MKLSATAVHFQLNRRFTFWHTTGHVRYVSRQYVRLQGHAATRRNGSYKVSRNLFSRIMFSAGTISTESAAEHSPLSIALNRHTKTASAIGSFRRAPLRARVRVTAQTVRVERSPAT